MNKRNEILGKLAEVDLSDREPGLLGRARAEGRPDLRDRRDQEPRDLLRAPRRPRRRPGRRDRRPDQARLRLGGRLARRPEGDRHGRPRLGVDGVRLGRGPPLQLHRRRPEHVPGLERDARSSRSTSTSTPTSSTSRPTARPTSRRSSTTSTGTSSTTGSPSTASRCAERCDPDRGRLPGRQHPDRVLARPRAQARGHPHDRQRQHRRRRTSCARSTAAAGWLPASSSCCRHGEGLCAGVRRDAGAQPPRGACSPGARRCSGTGGRSSSASSGAGRSSRRRAAASSSASRRCRRDRRSESGSSSSSPTRYVSLASMVDGVSMPVVAVLLGYPWPVIVFTVAAGGRRSSSCTGRTSAGC